MQDGMDVSIGSSSKGNEVLFVNQFKFHKKLIQQCGVVKWVCDRNGKTKGGCKAICYTEGVTTRIREGCFEHNHEANTKKYSRLEVSNSCKRKAIENPFEKPEKIMKREIETSEASESITDNDLTLIRKTMWKAKRKQLPPLPKSVEETQEALDSFRISTNKGEEFLLENDRQRKIVIFGCQTNIDHLKRAGRILMDGTFEYCCKYFTQLFTILIEVNGHYVPVLFCLLPDKKQRTYEALFSKIKVLMDDSPLCRVLVDFEISIHNAIKQVWPAAEIFGCRFHLTQSWIRKIQSLGLMPEYKKKETEVSKWLHIIFSLPHLPPDEVAESFIEDMMAEIPASQKVRKFSDYLVDSYISEDALFPPKIWASFGNEPVSNNPCESFHSKLQAQFYSAHPDIYTFVKQLTDFQILVYVKQNSLHEKPRQSGNVHFKRAQINLKKAKENYSQGTRKRYLELVSKRFCKLNKD